MKYRKLFVVCCLSLFVAGLAVSQEIPRELPPPGGEPKDFNLPSKHSIELPNGMGATFVQYGAVPKVDIRIVVRAGNLNEAPDEVWLADLTGDMMREGTTSRSAEQLAADVAGMGGTLSIGVGLDQSTIGSDALSDLAPEMVRLLADVLLNPTFPESELERLKKDRIRGLSIALSRPQPIADQEFSSQIYANHPYGRMFPTEEMLAGYTREDVQAFHAANFGAQRAHVYVVGKFDEAEVENAVRESFLDWTKGEAPTILPPEMRSSREIHLIDRPGAPQSTLRIGLPVIDPSHEDYMALMVTNSLLGGSFGSRITSNIREDKGYTYSPNSSISVNYRAAHWVQSADVTTDVTGASMKEIFYEIDRLRNEAPSIEELEGIQNYLAGIFVLRNSSRGGIIGQLANLRLHGLEDDYLTNYVRNIYAVTPEKVQEIARTYLSPDRMTIVIVGDRGAVEPQIKPYGKIVVD